MKFILLISLLTSSLILNAQINKGGLFIGGDVQIFGSKFESSNPGQYIRNTNNYNFSPSVGWVVNDNIVVGGKLLAYFFNDGEQNPSNYDRKGSNVGAGFWARKYIPVGKSFYLEKQA